MRQTTLHLRASRSSKGTEREGRRRSHPTIRLSLLGTLLLLSVSADESNAYRGPERPVDTAYFGMHVHRAAQGTAWPAVEFAGWRLWDAGVSWPQLEPQRDKWNFILLDQYVRIAAEHHVEILLTLGLTPAWASARPEEPSAYGKGNAAEPHSLIDWRNYVRAVSTRYKGVIHAYEIWNEPNVQGTFSGGEVAMLELSRAAYEVVKSVDAAAIVVSPSATADGGVGWLDEYLARGGCRYADVIGYHFYVTPEPPEKMISLIQKVKSSLRSRGCANKPLWNTESGWASPKHFSSDAEAAGYMMRTYLVNWLMGVDRCYWYAWDNHNWSTLELTTRSGNQMTEVGAAYGVIRSWMLGSVLRSCSRQGSETWICRLDRRHGTGWVLWSEGDPKQFSVPSSWHVDQIKSWNGGISADKKQIAGAAPILLEGRNDMQP